MREALKQLAVPLLIALALTGWIAFAGRESLGEAQSELDCVARRETLGRPVPGDACPEWTDAGVVGRW